MERLSLRTARALIISFSLLIAAASSGCDGTEIIGPDPEEGFSSFGLNSVSINKIEVVEGLLYAATEQGLYRRSLAEEAAWQLVGLDALHVADFTPLPGDEMLAAVRPDGDPGEEPTLYKWQGGEEWIPFQNDFGGEEGFSGVEAVASHPAGRDTVFARGAMNVAKSTDGGSSWRSVFQDWDSAGYQAPLIHFDPRDPSLIWGGGETSIFQPYVLRSTDYGETWTMISLDAGGDNAVYSMAVHPETGEILIGMEGRIMASTDDGETWSTVFEPESSAYILSMDVLEDGGRYTVFAAGSEGGTSGGRIVLYRSDDFGATWGRIDYPDGPQQTSTASIVVSETGGQTTVYLGTGHGVFRYIED